MAKKTNRSSRPPQRKGRARKARPLHTGRYSRLADSRLVRYFRRKQEEFRPDSLENGFWQQLYMTKLQRLHLLKWTLLVLLCVVLLVIQDVIMSRVSIFGATTDLVPCVILLITVMEGINVGSIFVVIASTLYQFSGFSPGAFAVGIMSLLGIFATLFRQAYWYRSRNSILLCAGVSMILYELGIYGVGVLTGLTNWYRISSFLITGVLSWIVMIPLYPLIDRIGQIGGSTWTE